MKKVALLVCFCAVAWMMLPSASAQRYNGGLVDKTIALVGNQMIMLSELESEVMNMKARGYTSTGKDLRCQLLEKMMEDKLFLIQAEMDSVAVNMDYIQVQLEEYVANMVANFGGVEAMEQYFGKKEYQLRMEWLDMFTEMNKKQEMQRELSNRAPELTPRQVQEFCRRTPKDSLPIISTQYKYRQIVLYPDKEVAAMQAKERLLEFRERILNGSSFSLLATMYSQDPGSAIRGGDLGMVSKSLFWPEFSEAASMLKDGQVSPIVETPDGYHLIEMIRQTQDMMQVRHILIKPYYGDDLRQAAFSKLDSLKRLIVADSISFQDAARYNSEDAKSRTNGGLVADELYTGASYFEVDMLKPADYQQLKDLQPGEISAPFESTDNEGRGNLVYKLVMLEEVIPSHTATFERDFAVLLNEANQQETKKMIEQFLNEKVATTYIMVDPMFQNCAFERAGWVTK
ncbi:MAG: peptidylprolyl isomerase [Bacteroidales bacterium]|nr:peptidylprolyl isomerase [Bacteroidales bacterium]